MKDLHPKKPEKFLKSLIPLWEDGEMKEKSHSPNMESWGTGDITLLNSLEKEKKKEELKSVIVGYPATNKKEILSVKSNLCEKNSLTTQSLKTTDRVLTLRGKVLKPFWTIHLREISKKLWLPTKTDYADLDTTSYNMSLNKHQVLKSWFLMKKSKHQEKN